MRKRHYSAEDSERDAAHAWEQRERNRQDASAEIKADCERDEAKASCAAPIDYAEGWPVCQEHLDAYLRREENQ